MSALLVATVLAAVLGAACDPGPAIHAIGVVGTDLGPELHYVLCPGQSVESVSVSAVRDPEDPDHDETVWAIAAGDSPSRSPWLVGQIPQGFRGVVDLVGDLPRDQTLVADVVTSTGTTTVLFTIATLDRSRVTTAEGGLLPMPEFTERAQARCR